MIENGYGVALRELSLDRLNLYRTNRNNYQVWRWCRQKSLIDRLQHEGWFERQSADPTIQMFEVVKDSEVVGVCGFTDIDYHSQRAEFSLYIFPSCAKKGYGSEALKTLVKFGFEELNFNMIWGECIGDNPAQRLFKRVGFEYTGFRPAMYFKGGIWQTAHMYCLLRSNWQPS